MYFYRNFNSLNLFLKDKTATFSRTMHVLLSVISRSQAKTIVQIFARVGVEPYATFKVRKTELFWPCPTLRASLANAPPWGKEKLKNAPHMPDADWARLELIQPLWQQTVVCLMKNAIQCSEYLTVDNSDSQYVKWFWNCSLWQPII